MTSQNLQIKEMLFTFHTFWQIYAARENNVDTIKDIIPFLDDNVTSIGTGEHELGKNISMVIKNFTADFTELHSPFLLDFFYEKARVLSPTSGLVDAEANVDIVLNTGEKLNLHLRFSTALVYKKNSWLISHIHLSFPSYDQNYDEAFPINALKSKNDRLTKQVAAHTISLKEKADQLNREKKRAERSERFKQDFLANMSHEIRTPMNAVLGLTNLVLETDLSEKQKFYVEGVKKASSNLLHIINEILDLSKLESGKMTLELIDFSILELIQQVKQTLSYQFEEKELSLYINIHPDIPEILIGDPARLNQILINLVGNALKFTESGSISLEVTKVTDKIQFAIIDTGIGISKDKLKSIFESFVQANNSDTRKFGGTGLGLSISQHLVKKMGGTIQVKSEVEVGSTFSFALNLKEGSKDNFERKRALETDIDGSALEGLKILVVDDNEFNRIVATDTLKSKATVVVHEATNGIEAVDLMRKELFDLVLMDVQMPVMNGLDATRFIRKKLKSPVNKTPIIALTASVFKKDLENCKKAGMDSYIPKPFSPEQLISEVAHVLKLKLVKSNEVKPISLNNPKKAITNLNYLTSFCEGDNNRIKKYVHLFVSTAPNFIEKIEGALENKNFELIANQVHGFKTKWIMMGMTDTKDLAIQLEVLAREEKNEKQISKLTLKLIDIVNEAVVELQT